jgi:hypothetical protein
MALGGRYGSMRASEVFHRFAGQPAKGPGSNVLPGKARIKCNFEASQSRRNQQILRTFNSLRDDEIRERGSLIADEAFSEGLGRDIEHRCNVIDCSYGFQILLNPSFHNNGLNGHGDDPDARK